MEGDPLLAVVGTLGQCLIGLGLHWASQCVPILGLGPALPLRDYLRGLGEQCQQVVNLLLWGRLGCHPHLGLPLPMPMALPTASHQSSAVADLDTSLLA